MKQFTKSCPAAEQIELLIHRCDSLPAFDQNIAKCLEILDDTPVKYDTLSEIIQTDPAASATRDDGFCCGQPS